MRRLLGRLAIALGVVAGLAIVFFVSLNLFGASQFGNEKLRQLAENALTSLAGVDVDAAIGKTSIAFDSSRLIALKVADVRLSAHGEEKPIIDAGQVRFGFRFLPLLTGHVRLDSVTIEDARIRPRMMPDIGGGDWAEGLRDARGLIEPDLVLKALFGRFHRAFDAVGAGSMREIQLNRVDFLTPGGPMPKGVHIEEARISRLLSGALGVSASAHALGMDFSVDGKARRGANGQIAALNLNVKAERPQAIEADASQTAAEHGIPLESVGAFDLAIKGVEADGGRPSKVTSTLSFRDATLDFGEDGKALVSGNIDSSLVEGAGKMELSRLRILSGHSQFNFHGAVGPLPKEEAEGTAPAYRYEFISDGSVSAPEDSPEAPLPFYAHVMGRYDVKARQLIASQIGVRTGPGELLGSASMTFVEGKAPGIFLAITVPSMPVRHVKQLWPWLAAPNARAWVLSNVFAGEVKDSSLQFHVAPGRLGNGIPLSEQEISGHFDIRGTRFDVAGRIPPVRDGNGIVDFRGNSVDISLSSGTVYMPGDRTVSASNGTFTMRNVHLDPVIGALDIDVAGKADAVTALASYDPINAMRRLGIKPEDFSGNVSGHVAAEIPLSKDVPADSLTFKVALDYTDLAVAEPIDGQTVSDADGSIVVEPDRAVVHAKARLNGIPAEIEMTRPLAEGGPPKARKITLELNDKARDALMPGLNDMLSGPVSVVLDTPEKDGGQPVKANLTAARLTLPWVGWTKGAGIPASVSFELDTNGKAVTLSDFRLVGKSFRASGNIHLTGNTLTEARFTSAKLNNGDNFSVAVARSSAGYQVTVRGDRLDARSIIKNVLSDPDSAAAKTPSGTPVKVTVDAKLDGVSGFNGEKLHNVGISYGGSGSRIGNLSINATTGSGANVRIANSDDGQSRTVAMHSKDAGAILRFLDLYDHMQGGTIRLDLAGAEGGPLSGGIDATNFLIVNEPRLKSIVGSTRASNSKTGRDINVSRARFERGYAQIEKGDGYLVLSKGVLRGPQIGSTFQGTLYDRNGHMDMTGTFMPAYGLNRLFGEIPIFGKILGNGRDHGLIGITYRLSGDAKSPTLQVNPISAIAPGIFRSIFEFR
ncbi:MAG: DUF3971 domain-containing protein [Hyphomicrobiales bacterium]|nr:DUF3971 domain-containing protein [Hyphomicrobiales bacterium]